MQIEKSGDNIYLNLAISNQSYDLTQNRNIQAVYDQTLTNPLLNNPSDYYLSIIRFSLPSNSIPIFRCPVDVSQNDPNGTPFFIGIELGASVYPERVMFVATNSLPAPTPAASYPYFSASQISSGYYTMFAAQPLVSMVNTALAAAHTASGIGGAAPYYIFDPTTQLFSLIVTQTFIASGAYIYMNNSLVNYFSGFNFYYVGTFQAAGTAGIRFRHILTPLPYGSPVGGPYKFDAEYDASSLWFDIRKIVVTSTSIPTSPEFNPVTTPLGIVASGLDSTSNTFPIITDFISTFDNFNEYGSTITYNPTTQYRLVDLNSNAPLNRIQLTFYWLSKNGTLYPLFLSPNQTITMKLAFIKKDLYKNTNTLKIK